MNGIGPVTREALEFVAKTTKDEPYLVVELAQKKGCTPATTCRLITHLKNRRLIESSPPRIGAGHLIQLTDRGRKALAGEYIY